VVPDPSGQNPTPVALAESPVEEPALALQDSGLRNDLGDGLHDPVRVSADGYRVPPEHADVLATASGRILKPKVYQAMLGGSCLSTLEQIRSGGRRRSGGHDDVVEPAEGKGGGFRPPVAGWVLIPDVDGGSSDPPVLKSLIEGFFIDNRSAGDVDQQPLWPEFIQCGRIYDSGCL
jgi:hypothetical protein